MKIRYQVGGYVMKAADAVYVLPDDDALEELATSVVNTISTSVEITLGGVTVFLAMLLDPEHWEEDWTKRGVEDAYAFVAGLLEPV